jgi:hypothetical protein
VITNRYDEEKANPSVPACAKAEFSLVFNGHFLTLVGNKRKSYPAVSGQPIAKGVFSYAVSRQKLSKAGPIPEGLYWIQPFQMWTNHWYSLAPREAWGDHRITIHVMPGTETYSRGGFFIHGGTHAGSAGCINLHAAMESFVRDLYAISDSSKPCFIPLRVQY